MDDNYAVEFVEGAWFATGDGFAVACENEAEAVEWIEGMRRYDNMTPDELAEERRMIDAYYADKANRDYWLKTTDSPAHRADPRRVHR